MIPDPSTTCGKVYLVGAGPGDPGLLTLRGADCLAKADVVLYDYLTNPQLLAHCSPHAELVCLGSHRRADAAGGGRLWQQAEINQHLVDAARGGQTVVRLKGGDPAVFAHTAEELAALAATGIDYEIVPGITAALAVGSHAGVPLTQGDHASAIAIVTGQERADKVDTSLDYAALAAFPGTLVFYMGITTVRHWTSELIAAGKSPTTPVAIVRRCSWPDQSMVTTTLGQAAELVEQTRVRPPVVFIVGQVADQAGRYDWFTHRPLFGKKVLVTRPIHQSQALCRAFAELGARVLVQPAIEIGPPDDAFAAADAALADPAGWDWIVFSSANGVQAFCQRLKASGRDARWLGRAKIAAIGPGTADELARHCLIADILPSESFRAEALAESLTPYVQGKRVLLVRASRGREILAEMLQNYGAQVHQAVFYASRDVQELLPDVKLALDQNQLDWITVTSSAIARSLAALLGEKLKDIQLASISPITSATLRELGVEPAVEATEYTMAGVVAAIVGCDARV
jgi:uroporphyrinogen III methyltransferase/synthase